MLVVTEALSHVAIHILSLQGSLLALFPAKWHVGNFANPWPYVLCEKPHCPEIAFVVCRVAYLGPAHFLKPNDVP